jgi:hypothetical protein
MNLQQIANRFHKTNRWVFVGTSKVSIDNFKKKGIVDCFPEVGSEFKLAGLEFYKQLEISHKLLPLIKEKGKTDLKDKTEDKLKRFLDGNILFQDVSDVNNLLIFNKEDREIVTDTDPNVYLRKLPKEERLGIVLNLPVGKVGYNAYQHEPIFDSESASVPIKILNLYQPPKWRKEFPDARPEWLEEPPELFKRFLDFLVPDEREREEVISWICWALVQRHHNYLMLRGARGNGKTIFMKTIMGVVGGGYIALDGVLTDFNADMKHKRLVGIDDDTEIGTAEGNRKRKRLINTKTTFQEKHKQTTESEEQYASYVICSNPSDRFYVLWDERRIVQVGLTNEKLDEMMDYKERNFLDTLDDDNLSPTQIEFLAHLGHWLLMKAKTNSRSYVHCYKGGTFWNDVVNSLGGFQRRVVEMILDREQKEYSFEDIVFDWKEDKTHRQVVPHWSNFRETIQAFRYKDEPIVESINNKKRTFKPIEKYLPEMLEDIDPMEVDI